MRNFRRTVGRAEAAHDGEAHMTSDTARPDEAPSLAGAFKWSPTPEIIADTNLTAFLRQNDLADFDSMFARAERDPAWFWQAVLEWAEIRFFKPYEAIVDQSRGLAWTKWCLGGSTNIVLNCFDRYRDTPTY